MGLTAGTSDGEEGDRVDYSALFGALPTPYLVMTPDLVMVEANPAYLTTVGRTREELLGRPVFEAFPPTDDALDEQSGVSRVQLSFERARDTGQPDTMPLQKYDITDPETGELAPRYWSLISVPVLDAEGRTKLVVQRAEDVTEHVQEREKGEAERRRGLLWRRKVEQVESDLLARSSELEAAVETADVAGRRLNALAEVALLMSSAQTIDDLTTIIIDRGLAALGADGGAVAVHGAEGMLELTLTQSLGEVTRVEYGQLPLDGPLPAAVTARTGEPVLLPDRDACLDFGPEMQAVVEITGCTAWACLPLRNGDRLLGSLSVGWRSAHPFPPGEQQILDALAAQCSQGLERVQARQVERRAAVAAQRMSETLQRSLLTDPPQPDGLQIAVRYRPAAREAQVGGDWYDAFVTADGIPALVIGDVAGHDRDAAAAMGQMRNLLRGIAYALGEPPAAVLAALDRALDDLAVGSLATGVLARLQPVAAGWLLRWSNAGHPPPLVVQPDGSVELLRTPADLLLGLDATTSRDDHERELPLGSTVLLYTDGLVERRGASLDAGFDAMAEVVSEVADLPLEELCDVLLDRLGRAGDDDVALLAVRLLDDRDEL